MASVYDFTATAIEGGERPLEEFRGQALLIVNTASRCGFTGQYAGLEALQKRFADKPFQVLGFPCNQFGQQEPGRAAEIASFCSTTYGVDFPMFDKIEVNGDNRHALYQLLTGTPDAEGNAGDVAWNFEKFLVGRDGSVVARFRPQTLPDDPDVVGAIKQQLQG